MTKATGSRTGGIRLVVASGNAHKVSELAGMLGDALGRGTCNVVGLAKCVRKYGPVPDIEETAADFVGNAALKAQGIAAWLHERGEPGGTRVLADDSGVCVDGLDGRPGVLSARFCGHHGSDADNNAKLVQELTARELTESPAHYACVLALCRVDGRALPGSNPLMTFHGRWDVVARVTPRGDGGFGYDPHCWLQDADQTVAELTAEAKAKLSHRGAAFGKLVSWWKPGRVVRASPAKDC